MPSDGRSIEAFAGPGPDFLWGGFVAIYIDGPHHLYPDRQKRDQEQEDCLFSAGYSVIRFDTDRDDWDAIVKKHPWVFGEMR
ncbi:MAG: hypothetical protein R3A46_12665 [Thermomicrobiales bacterium]